MARFVRLVAASSVMSLLVLGLSAASANAASDEGGSPQAVEVPMTILGIDEAQAAKVGNTVTVEGLYKVLRDGVTGKEITRVPLDGVASPLGTSTRFAALSPNTIVTGNCGTAYMWLRDIANSGDKRLYQFDTGFDLTMGSAYDFDWYVNIYANWGSGAYNFDWEDHGPLWPTAVWTSGWETDDTDAWQGTTHTARVTSGTAYLTNGGVCWSGYPTDHIAVN